MQLSLSSEALARASARRPWIVVGAWIALIVVAIGINFTLLAGALTNEFGFTNNPESVRADKLLEERLRGPRELSEVVIVQSEALTVDDQAFRDRVEALYEDISALGPEKVEGGSHYYQESNDFLVSSDRHTTIMPFVMAGDYDDATSNVEEILDMVSEANEIDQADIQKGERIGVSLALIILLILFGALLAALIPLLLAGVAIVVALAATALIGQFFQLVFFVTIMIIMIGMAVGIDYSLIILSRYREELRRGLGKIEAIARSGATAGRTVFFSGVTVVFALLGMLIIPSTVYQSLATGAILVVIAAVMAALTLLPASLSLLGGKVNALRVPILGRRLDKQAAQNTGGFWDWLTHRVMKRPIIFLVVTAGLLIAAASPVFGLNTGFNGVDGFPDDIQAKEAFLVLEQEPKFSFGATAPTEIAIEGDVNSESVQAAIQRLQAALESDPDFAGEFTVEDNGRDLTLMTAQIAGEPSSDRSVDALERLRTEHIPEPFDSHGVQAEVLVTGLTAFAKDFFDIVGRFTPVVFVFVLGLSFVLLTLVFRSIVIPAKAILMNLLSVGAAYGLLAGISHIGSLQAQRAAQTRWQHHSQVLQGQSIAGLSNKRCVCSRRAPFLSVFIVLVSPASGVKPH